MAENTPRERELEASRINEAIATGVAIDKSYEAEQERERANHYERETARTSITAEQERRSREAAETSAMYANSRAATADGEAQTASFGFWLLAGLAMIAVIIGSVWYINQSPTSPSTSTTIVRNNTIEKPVDRPVLVPVDRPVAVPVDRPVPVIVPGPAPAQPSSSPKSEPVTPEGTQGNPPPSAPTTEPNPNAAPGE